MNRALLVHKLVNGVRLTFVERQALGGYVRRDEIAAAIAREFEEAGRFPREAPERGGRRLVATDAGVLLVTNLSIVGGSRLFASAADAIARYVDAEYGPSCGGVPIRT